MTSRIAKNNVESVYALSPMQEGMLFYYIKSPSTVQYQEQLSTHIEGDVDIELFRKAWQFVVDLNEPLRTVFKWEKIKKPVQIVCKDCGFKVSFIDYSEDDSLSIEEKSKKALEYDKSKSFDIENETFRVVLVKLQPGSYLMIISNHHIIYDGWSNGIIINEFISCYERLKNNEKINISPKCKFEDFVKWINKQDINKANKYWSNYLDHYTGYPGISDSIETSNNYVNYEISLAKDLSGNINDFIRSNKVTSASLIYLACGILLQRLSNSEDVVFGTTVSGRNASLKGIEDMVGNCINSLPLRIKARKGDNKFDILTQVNKDIGQRESYEWTPLVEINKFSSSNDKTELFDVLVIVENYPLDIKGLNEKASFKFELYKMDEATHYDLTIIVKIFNEIEICFSYDTGRYSREYVENISSYFENILRTIIDNQITKIDEISILKEDDRQTIIEALNYGKVEYPEKSPIHKLFQQQACKTPEKDALRFNSERISYKELDVKSDQLALLLRNKGVKRDDFVGIMMGRSMDMIISILGILKSGAAYLPIDPEYPTDRIIYMVNDSKSKIILTDDGNIENCNEIGSEDIINVQDHPCFKGADVVIENINSSSDFAYVIYTSGSTGKPKGVMIEHKSVVNFVEGITSVIDFSDTKSILALTTISFDIFVLEIILPLLKGNTVVIAGESAQKSAEDLSNLIKNSKIEILQVTPSRLKLLSNYDEELKCLENVTDLLVGGEQFPEDLFKSVKSKFKNKIYNLYGPTEATVWVTIKDLTHSDVVTIGYPIQNTRLYVLNKFGEIQPDGVIGELFIAGDCLARGYHNNDSLNEERFIKNSTLNENRLYNTGDLAKILPSGEIDCLGRVDNQVKIRGFRVELEEIEKCLVNLEDITDAVAVAKHDAFNVAYLCAYYVGNKEFEYDELEDHLIKDIPNYMVPSHFIRLNELPLTPNDKIDRLALPEPNLSTKKYSPPESDDQKQMVHIWSEVLDVDFDNISIDADFFKIGGHSLKATMLLSKIHKEFNVKITVNELFEHPTIIGLCKKIKNSDNHSYCAIPRVPEKEYYPVTSLQKRLYILQKTENDFTAYNMSGVLTLNEEVDLDKIQSITQYLINYHETFRTSFHIIDDEIVQKIHKEVKNPIEFIDISDDVRSYDKEYTDEVIQSLIKPFDLSNGGLIRFAIIKRGSTDYLLFVDVHHIVFDGISQQIIIRDFLKLYKGINLPNQDITYKDYTVWLDKEKSKSNYLGSYNFWHDRFKEEIPVFDILGDTERKIVQNFEGGVVDFVIDKKQTEQLKELSSEYGCTLFMALFSVYNILLSKLSGNDKIVVGVPIAGRENDEIKDIVGLFVNTLPVLNTIDNNSSYKYFLEQTRNVLLDAFDHKYLIIEDLIENLNIERNAGRNPLFDVLFVFQGSDDQDFSDKNRGFELYEFHSGVSKFDLTLEGREINNEINFRVEYASSLYTVHTIKRFVEYFKKIINVILVNQQVVISEIDVLPEIERNKILTSFNNTTQKFQAIKPIHEIFEEAVEEYSISIAAYDDSRKFTYQKLNERSNQIAWNILNRRLKNEVIGIIAERSLEFLAGVLGILKAGCAYMPIDAETPKARIDFILEDCKVKLILFPGKVDLDLSGYRLLKLTDSKLSKESTRNTNIEISPNDLAYVIYTSGSTGKPKGVEIEHKSVVNLLYSLHKKYPLKNKDKYLIKTPCVFDVSISELFGWFMNGGSAVILKNGAEKEVSELVEAISDYGITHLNFVPSMLNLFLDTLKKEDIKRISSLKYIFVAGEELKPESVHKFKALETDIVLENLYGPTEATIYASSYSLRDWDGKSCIPIGKPLPNTKLFILDEFNNLQPIGVKGELCIAGDCLGRGYRKNKELTSEKFVKSPFSVDERIYKTGDLAAWLYDGNIRFLGRKDDQVKIRGYRIELGDIENQILFNEEVENAVVIITEVGGENSICAYIISDKNLEELDLRNFLSQRIPSYMIPAYFVKLDMIPLNQNGKLDKKKLPPPEFESIEEIYMAENDIQKELIIMWSEVLNVPENKIGVNTDFFSIGGHSLKATFLLARINEKYHVEISLGDIFKCPTVYALANLISKSDKANHIYIIPKAQQKDFYPVSYEQKMIFVLQELNKESLVYNMPAMFLIEQSIEVDKFKDSFHKTIQRHESLRTVFDLIDNQPVQKVLNDPKLFFEYIELEDDLINDYFNSFVKPFNLRNLPLLRVSLIKVGLERFYLLIDVHHIVFDGVSINILIKEVFDHYYDRELNVLEYQYKDYACWQKSSEAKVIYEKQKNFWLNKFDKGQVELNIPIDFPRKKVKNNSGNVLSFEISNEMYLQLSDISKKQNVTLNIVLLASYYILMLKWSKQNDITIGIPVAGRRNKALQNIIGMFVNTLALKDFVGDKDSFSQFLMIVKDSLLEAYDNQDYPFNELVEDLNLAHESNRNPLFDVAFSYMDTYKEHMDSSDMNFKLLPYVTKFSRFDLTLFVSDLDNKFLCSLEYSTEVFSYETIQLLKDRYLELLQNIINNQDSQICELSFETEEERKLSENKIEMDFDF